MSNPRSFRSATTVFVLLLGAARADADPVRASAPAPLHPTALRSVENPPRPFAAAEALRDLHANAAEVPGLSVDPYLAVSIRGVQTRSASGRAHTAAAVTAFVGAALIATSREGAWCSGPRCEAGALALLAAAPLLDAAARDDEASGDR